MALFEVRIWVSGTAIQVALGHRTLLGLRLCGASRGRRRRWCSLSRCRRRGCGWVGSEGAQYFLGMGGWDGSRYPLVVKHGWKIHIRNDGWKILELNGGFNI